MFKCHPEKEERNHKCGDISDIAIFQTVSWDFRVLKILLSFKLFPKDFSSSSLGWTWQPRARKVNGVCWRLGCNFGQILEFKLGRDDILMMVFVVTDILWYSVCLSVTKNHHFLNRELESRKYILGCSQRLPSRLWRSTRIGYCCLNVVTYTHL